MTYNNEAAVLHGVGDLRIEPWPVPDLDEREVLIEVRSVGVCGSDAHYYEYGRIADFVVRSPLVLGHEASGIVVGRGASATLHPIGQRVALEPGIPCGVCTQCRHGRYNLCPDVRFFATPPIDGAFARYVATDERFVHPLPDSLTDDEGALIEPLSVGVWANRKAGTSIGSRVLVTGAGPIGVLAAQVAKASGASHVAILDTNLDRLAIASSLGIDEILDARENPPLSEIGADILIECSGASAVTAQGIEALAPAGTAVLVGMGPDSVQPLPTGVIQSRELTVTGTFRYANTYPEAIALVAAGRVQLSPLVGCRLPLEETERGLRMSHIDPSVLKTVIAVA